MNPPPLTPSPAAWATDKLRAVVWTVVSLIGFAIVFALTPQIIGGITYLFQMTDYDGDIKITKAKIQSLEAAVASFKLRHNFIPTESQGLEALVTRPSDPRIKEWKPLVKPAALMDSWDNKMQYRKPGTHNPEGYDLFSFGPDGVESLDDIGNW